MDTNVLIIDDDEKLIELLSQFLQGYNYNIRCANKPSQADKILMSWRPDIVILDLMMPEKNGLDYCQDLRQKFSFPIIMLTAKGEVADKVLGLEMGADDYMPKPFEPRELVARMRALLRRGEMQNANAKTDMPSVFSFANIEVNFDVESLQVNGEQIPITYTEFQLLKILIQNKNCNVSRDQIMDNLKGLEYQAYDRSIDVQISRLRSKLGDDAKHPKLIKTIRSRGYRLTVPENS